MNFVTTITKLQTLLDNHFSVCYSIVTVLGEVMKRRVLKIKHFIIRAFNEGRKGGKNSQYQWR